VIGLVDEEKIVVGQLMVQKEGCRGYIVREMTRGGISRVISVERLVRDVRNAS